MEQKLYDVAIIGGGPGGYTAGLYCARSGFSVVVLEKLSPGGQMATTGQVDNYPGFEGGVDGFELGEKMQRGAERFGGETRFAEVTGVELAAVPKVIQTSEGEVRARAVVLATGASPREMGLPGEQELRGRGVAYCATCDGMLYKGKTVAVIGDSEEARHDAQFLSDIGCKVLSFSGREKLDIRGGMKADTLVADGTEYAVDCVFILKDTLTAESLVSGIESERGIIKTDRSCKTNIKGVFAAGDCTGAPYQIAKAVGDGNIAALSACEYINTEKEI